MCTRLRFPFPSTFYEAFQQTSSWLLRRRSEPIWSNKLTKLYNTFNDIIISEFIMSAHFSVLHSQFVVHCIAVKITVVALYQSHLFNSYDLLEIRENGSFPNVIQLTKLASEHLLKYGQLNRSISDWRLNWFDDKDNYTVISMTSISRWNVYLIFFFVHAIAAKPPIKLQNWKLNIPFHSIHWAYIPLKVNGTQGREHNDCSVWHTVIVLGQLENYNRGYFSS